MDNNNAPNFLTSCVLQDWIIKHKRPTLVILADLVNEKHTSTLSLNGYIALQTEKFWTTFNNDVVDNRWEIHTARA